MDIEKIKRTTNRLVNYIIQCFWPRIEPWNWRHNNGSSLCRLIHQPDMARMKWGFTKHQNYAAPFFQTNISGAGGQFLVKTIGNRT
jgi:hypothetical protein